MGTYSRLVKLKSSVKTFLDTYHNQNIILVEKIL